MDDTAPVEVPSVDAPVNEIPQTDEIPDALRNVDPEKLRALREKLAKFARPTGEKTISGSEAVPDSPEAQGVTTGKDVDWSEYDLDFSVKHLYKNAEFRMTAQGPKWIVLLDEFHSIERDFGNYRKKVKSSRRDGETEPLNLGDYLNDMLNAPEGWRLVSVMPAGLGRAGVVLQRSVPYVLPDPRPIKKETEVEPPMDGELAQIEDAALEFMKGEDLAPEPQSSLEQTALALNGPAVRDPGTIDSTNRGGSLVDAKVAGKQAETALQGEDFEKPVTEEGNVEG
jgi:hypothetical protein